MLCDKYLKYLLNSLKILSVFYHFIGIILRKFRNAALCSDERAVSYPERKIVRARNSC